ncbi:MAG TPA: SgcJ/EcaC family oxidoreductase [Gemmataceae bacterium]|nr:SgcJ/EcaC family oxidoreductase [Gemmataceae bacterium]
MSLNKTVLTAIGLLCPTPFVFAAEDARTEVRQAIDRGNAQYIKSMKEADAAGVAGVYAVDGVRFHEKGKMSKGRQKIQADLEGFLKRTGPVKATIDTLDLWVVDNLAYETGKWSYTYQQPGKDQVKMAGQYVTVWRKQPDGGWKIIADMPVPKE